MSDFIAFLRRKKVRLLPYYREHGLYKTLIGIAAELSDQLQRLLDRWRLGWILSLLKPLGGLRRLPGRIRSRGYIALATQACLQSYRMRKWFKARTLSDGPVTKILHVTCSFDLGGTQRQIMNLCESSPDGRYRHEAVEIFPEQNYLYRTGVVLDRSRYLGGGFLSRCLGPGTLDYSKRSLHLHQIHKLERDFRAERPDIVVGWGHEIALTAFVAASLARVPGIVFCIRTFNPAHGWTQIGPLIYKAHKRMVPLVDGVIVNSTSLRKDYSQWLGISEDSVRVCANGIDFTSVPEASRDRGAIRREYGIPDEAVVILNMGRFSEEKGQMLLVRAFRRLVESNPGQEVRCLLCGDGPTLPEVKGYIERHALQGVHLPGRVDDIHRFYAAVDLFVMPSDFEGMPNAMMEAMAHGLPCISTTKSGIVDIARAEKEALYIEVGAVDQLADTLARLVSDPDLRLRLGGAARERLKAFSVPRMVKTFNGHLDEIVQGLRGADREEGV